MGQTINAPMTRNQEWVPLEDPGSLPAGLYDLDGETIDVSEDTDSPPLGQICDRGQLGTEARAHSAGASLTRISIEPTVSTALVIHATQGDPEDSEPGRTAPVGSIWIRTLGGEPREVRIKAGDGPSDWVELWSD